MRENKGKGERKFCESFVREFFEKLVPVLHKHTITVLDLKLENHGCVGGANVANDFLRFVERYPDSVGVDEDVGAYSVLVAQFLECGAFLVGADLLSLHSYRTIRGVAL